MLSSTSRNVAPWGRTVCAGLSVQPCVKPSPPGTPESNRAPSNAEKGGTGASLILADRERMSSCKTGNVCRLPPLSGSRNAINRANNADLGARMWSFPGLWGRDCHVVLRGTTEIAITYSHYRRERVGCASHHHRELLVIGVMVIGAETLRICESYVLGIRDISVCRDWDVCGWCRQPEGGIGCIQVRETFGQRIG